MIRPMSVAGNFLSSPCGAVLKVSRLMVGRRAQGSVLKLIIVDWPPRFARQGGQKGVKSAKSRTDICRSFRGPVGTMKGNGLCWRNEGLLPECCQSVARHRQCGNFRQRRLGTGPFRHPANHLQRRDSTLFNVFNIIRPSSNKSYQKSLAFFGKRYL